MFCYRLMYNQPPLSDLPIMFLKKCTVLYYDCYYKSRSFLFCHFVLYCCIIMIIVLIDTVRMRCTWVLLYISGVCQVFWDIGNVGMCGTHPACRPMCWLPLCSQNAVLCSSVAYFMNNCTDIHSNIVRCTGFYFLLYSFEKCLSLLQPCFLIACIV